MTKPVASSIRCMLFMSAASGSGTPGAASTSGSSRAQTSAPSSLMCASVSMPIGSITSGVRVRKATCGLLTFCVSVRCSGRMPKVTLLPA